MRHQKRGNKLGRSVSHRKAMLSNMVISLFLHKQIKTTEAKAKEARRLAERLITHAKKDSTHARRLVFSILRDKKATELLFEEIAPVYTNRQGGYTRLIKLGYRPNDTARIVLLQLVDFFTEESAKEKKATAKKAGAKATAKKDVKPEKAAKKEQPKEVPVAKPVAIAEADAEVPAEESVNTGDVSIEETVPEEPAASEDK